MRLSILHGFVTALQGAMAAQSWAGSNLYYAAGLTTAQQNTLFTGLQASGVKVLRVWLDGQSSSQKGTAITSFPSLQGVNGPTPYDDTVLNRLDDLMVNAKSFGIKLMISLHSFNTLEANNDFYGRFYGTGSFYTDATARKQFQDRIFHVLAHVNPHNGKPWSQCNEYIFAFEAQNEAMNNDEAKLRANGPDWQCTMANTIKSALNGNTNILVTTGGGGWVDTSLLNGYFTCSGIDVLAIHAYGTGDLTKDKLTPYVTKAVQNNKKLIIQEWGACYHNTPNNNCQVSGVLSESSRAANLRNWAKAFGDAGVPWMYWQIIPNNDPHYAWDYEVGTTESIFSVVKEIGNAAKNYYSPFDFSRWLN